MSGRQFFWHTECLLDLRVSGAHLRKSGDQEGMRAGRYRRAEHASTCHCEGVKRPWQSHNSEDLPIIKLIRVAAAITMQTVKFHLNL